MCGLFIVTTAELYLVSSVIDRVVPFLAFFKGILSGSI